MTAITGATTKTLMNLSAEDISDTNMEPLIDLAINLINLYTHEDSQISNLQGAAGSKTITLDSKQAGAVQLITREIYYGFYKGQEAVQIGGIAVSVAAVMGKPQFRELLKSIALNLKPEMEADVG